MIVEIIEAWESVGRWWTDAPLRRSFAVLRTDDVDEDVRVCVCFDSTTKEWSLIPEPVGEETEILVRLEEQEPWPSPSDEQR